MKKEELVNVGGTNVCSTGNPLRVRNEDVYELRGKEEAKQYRQCTIVVPPCSYCRDAKRTILDNPQSLV